METIFGLPGMGSLLVDTGYHSDYPVVQGVHLPIASIIVFVKRRADVIYASLDPRIRYQ